VRAGAGWYSHTGSIECSVLNCAYTYECVGLGVCVSVKRASVPPHEATHARERVVERCPGRLEFTNS